MLKHKIQLHKRNKCYNNNDVTHQFMYRIYIGIQEFTLHSGVA